MRNYRAKCPSSVQAKFNIAKTGYCNNAKKYCIVVSIVFLFAAVKSEPTEKTTIAIDAETHRLLKIKAACESMGVTEAATEAIQEWVGKTEKPDPKKKESV